MSPEEVTRRIEIGIGNLHKAQQVLEEALKREAEAESDYRRARAVALLASSGTVAEREAHVDRAVTDERKRAQLAAGNVKPATEAVRNHRESLGALRSVASLSKVQQL